MNIINNVISNDAFVNIKYRGKVYISVNDAYEKQDTQNINILKEIVFLKFQQNFDYQEILVKLEDEQLQGLEERLILLEVRKYFIDKRNGNFWSQLRFLNTLRCNNYFHIIDDWTPLEYGGCIAGEVGEIIDLVKKDKRGDRLLDKKELEKEIGDVLSYLDLLASMYNIDLEQAVKNKFNEVSLNRLKNCGLVL